MTDGIKDTIIRVNEDIYDYKLKDLTEDLYAIMDEVSSRMKTVTGMDRNMVNSIYKAILRALEKRDYLLIADILIFELLPVIEADSKA